MLQQYKTRMYQGSGQWRFFARWRPAAKDVHFLKPNPNRTLTCTYDGTPATNTTVPNQRVFVLQSKRSIAR